MRPIHEIADDITKHWQKPYFAAVPYISAMRWLFDLNSYYLMEPASHIIRGFLGASVYWRGADAKRIKLELKQMLDES